MALEMNAVRKVNVRNEDHESEDERYTVQIARGGKPVSSIQPDRISAVEEEVMAWRSANHIHGWFLKNVQDSKDDEKAYCVSDWKLRELLEVCERVLNASHLVIEAAYKASDYEEHHRRMETRGGASKVIKHVSVARKLLPIRGEYETTLGIYDEAYLKDVQNTRDWAERMLQDTKAGVQGDIYYQSSNCW